MKGLLPGPDVAGRYAVDFGTGVTYILDADGNLDAALRASPLRDSELKSARRAARDKDEHPKHDPVTAVRLLGPPAGTREVEIVRPDFEDLAALDRGNGKEEAK